MDLDPLNLLTEDTLTSLESSILLLNLEQKNSLKTGVKLSCTRLIKKKFQLLNLRLTKKDFLSLFRTICEDNIFKEN